MEGHDERSLGAQIVLPAQCTGMAELLVQDEHGLSLARLQQHQVGIAHSDLFFRPAKPPVCCAHLFSSPGVEGSAALDRRESPFRSGISIFRSTRKEPVTR